MCCLEYKYVIENKSTHPLPPPEEGIKVVPSREGKIREANRGVFDYPLVENPGLSGRGVRGVEIFNINKNEKENTIPIQPKTKRKSPTFTKQQHPFRSIIMETIT